jgi:hypothetical protein
MADDTHDRDAWERRWTRVLREHSDTVASRPPNVHLLAEVADLPPGLALDAGCGHGAEAMWRAASGWRVGGTLLLVGHQPVDPATDHWRLVVAEERRCADGAGVDAVVRAVRRA